jgi:cystathionine gamma-synthase
LKQFLTGDRPQYSNGNHGIWIEDAVTIELNSRNFQERMLVINRNTESICDLLRAHPKGSFNKLLNLYCYLSIVDKVYYPKYFNRRMFEKFRRLGRMGFGGLFSITFKRPEDAIKFYDSIEIAKGPSLGTNFSICCPYTLLAHYYELEFAESYGVSRYLLRFSIGLEEMEDLKAIFLRALKA